MKRHVGASPNSPYILPLEETLILANTTSPPETPPLADLIGRCALRDESAFTALYQATSSKLLSVILRIVIQRHWAEEVLQEGYMNIWRHADSYSAGRGAPMTWMTNIMRNQAFDFLRRAEYRAYRRETSAEETLVGSNPGPQQQTEMSAELARLHHCLERLAERQRRCVLLIHHEGFTPVEAAQREGVPLGTVKTWVRRGLMRLRECLSE
jgi:RNA polymerase sigma-70 factor (ECF subfamily)